MLVGLSGLKGGLCVLKVWALGFAGEGSMIESPTARGPKRVSGQRHST